MTYFASLIFPKENQLGLIFKSGENSMVCECICDVIHLNVALESVKSESRSCQERLLCGIVYWYLFFFL